MVVAQWCWHRLRSLLAGLHLPCPQPGPGELGPCGPVPSSLRVQLPLEGPVGSPSLPILCWGVFSGLLLHLCVTLQAFC